MSNLHDSDVLFKGRVGFKSAKNTFYNTSPRCPGLKDCQCVFYTRAYCDHRM